MDLRTLVGGGKRMGTEIGRGTGIGGARGRESRLCIGDVRKAVGHVCFGESVDCQISNLSGER